MVFLTSGLVALLGLGLRSIVNVKSQDTVAGVASSQIVTIDTRKFNVLGIDGDFRTNASSQLFNPTNTTPPFFQAFDPAFLSVLGKNPSIRSIVSNPSFAFAHEAPIWLPSTDEVFFASNDGGPLGMSDINNNNQYAKIGLKEVASSIQAAGGDSVNISVTKLDLPDTVQMTNGGTGPFRGALLLVNSGRGPIPPSIALVDPSNPQNTTIILDNFFGRQFNSLNDVKIHRQSGKIFFTDTFYGFLNEFRPSPLLPGQVYRFDPDTGDVRVVADGFNKPNGIALSQDGKSAFVTDTGTIGGTPTDPATIYKFDIDPTTQAFLNRKVFAFTDAGIPDGIQLDSKGNVYSGCADGTQVWNPEGKLIGKFFLGTLSANMIFAGKGRLVIMGETSIFFAEIAAEGFDLSFES